MKAVTAQERTATAGQATDDLRGGVPVVEVPTAVSPRDARELSRPFFDRLAVLEEGTHEHQYVRNTLIEMNLSLVRYAASRFRGRGDSMEDIVQVGTIGLIKAIDRFELAREVEFTSFAVPYIVGEIKRFFRDTSWAVHVPRRLQEARVELARATDELQTRLGRMPTTRELSQLMSLSEEEVIEARKASNCYTSASLDAALTSDGGPDGESVLADFIGAEELPRTRGGLPLLGAPHRPTGRAGAADPASAVRRGAHAGRDRQGAGHLADACLTAHQPHGGATAAGTAGRRGRLRGRYTAPSAAGPPGRPAAVRAAPACMPGRFGGIRRGAVRGRDPRAGGVAHRPGPVRHPDRPDPCHAARSSAGAESPDRQFFGGTRVHRPEPAVRRGHPAPRGRGPGHGRGVSGPRHRDGVPGPSGEPAPPRSPATSCWTCRGCRSWTRPG